MYDIYSQFINKLIYKYIYLINILIYLLQAKWHGFCLNWCKNIDIYKISTVLLILADA